MNARLSTESDGVMKRQVTDSKPIRLMTAAFVLSMSLQPAAAQESAPATETGHMPGMNHESMPAEDPGHVLHGDSQQPAGMGKQNMDHGKGSGMSHSMDHGAGAAGGGAMGAAAMGAGGMKHGAMQGGSAPADARDPHAYSGGFTIDSGPYDLPGPRLLKLADEHRFGSVWFNRLEGVRRSGETAAVYEVQAWYGRDYDRLVLEAEGDYDNGELEEARTEVSWGHAVAAYWNTQLGVRFDTGIGPDRTWLGFGIEGLAPYWFEVDLTGYIGDSGRTALSLEAEYEMLFTQRLILQPRFEADVYGKEDNERGIGSGLSEVSAGLRLRYEIRRELAPYVGVEWTALYGDTADSARAAGVDTRESQAVAGVRFWF